MFAPPIQYECVHIVGVYRVLKVAGSDLTKRYVSANGRIISQHDDEASAVAFADQQYNQNVVYK